MQNSVLGAPSMHSLKGYVDCREKAAFDEFGRLGRFFNSVGSFAAA